MKIFNLMVVASLTILCLCWFGCTDEGEKAELEQTDDEVADLTEELSGTDFNILFIGNSLTYTNDLPSLVKFRAEHNGINLGIKMIARGNYALIDHWDDGVIQKEIRTKQYDYVVIQQGPSSQAFGHQILVDYGRRITTLCDEYEAVLAYYMVWPALTNYDTFEAVIKNHENAASRNRALLCPVGAVWKSHFDTTDDFDYYGSDGFHPSIKGSEVAAEVIFNTLTE